MSAEETQGGDSYSKGHLFEKLMVHVRHSLGCAKTTTQHLKVKSDGIELIISTNLDTPTQTWTGSSSPYRA